MIVRHAGIEMTVGTAAGALAVFVLLLGLACDARSPSSRRADVPKSQKGERPAPAPVNEPPSSEPETPRPVERTPPLVEPARPSAPTPAAKSPAPPRGVAPPDRTTSGGLATNESTPHASQPRQGSTSPQVTQAPQERTSPPTNMPPAPSTPRTNESTPRTATLDLSSLEQRLRDTKAIGVFTKLSLKNQVDDLLQEFREFHQSHDQALLPKLRQAFDLLLLKVLSLLQDSDPGLARDISSSRGELWSILTDPEKFKNVE